jgi:putative aldouronate transport system permease protein
MKRSLSLKNRIGDTRDDKFLNIVNIVFLSVVLILYIYPIYFIVIASLSDPNSIWNGEVTIVPVNFSFEGYNEIMKNPELWRGYLNSIFYTSTGICINLFLTLTAAYVLACREFIVRGAVMKIFTFTMFFSGGLIPNFLLVQRLGLLNTMWAVLLPGAASVFNIIITRTFFMFSIPNELKEAAVLDGCGHTKYLVFIVLPLSTAIIAVIALYYGVGHWNAWFEAMIYLRDRTLFPLQLILREILIRTASLIEIGAGEVELARQMRIAEGIKYCSILVASIPPLIAYPFVQKFFVKGVMMGSIKG